MSVLDDPSSSATTDETTSPTDSPTEKAARTGGGWFRAFWRWHFYASALVIPILLMLAVTGLIYLFRWQIDPAMHPGLLTVDVPSSGVALPYAQQEAAAKALLPNSTVEGVQQGFDDRATAFSLAVGAGDDATSRTVYVNQYTGEALGSIDPSSLLSNIAVEIHGKIVFGEFSEIGLFHDPIVGEELTLGGVGDRIIELAACWAIVMALTGYYLFFRGRTARVRRVAKKAPAAVLRNRHALIGAFIGGGLLLLVVSGLPWTGLWGGKVQQWAGGHGLSLWGEDPGAESTLGTRLTDIGSSSAPAPWAEGQQQLPTSGTGGSTVSIDTAIQAASATGLAGPYFVSYPADGTGVYSVLGDQWHDKANPAFSDVSRERTVHVDQYSGEVLAQYGYADYSPAAKVVSQGIALHEGRRLGSFNLVATTAFCLGVIFLCVSGPLMWWKRRPKTGGLAAPRGRMPLKATPALAVALVLLGVFLPLFGVSLLLVLAFDQWVVRRIPALSKFFGAVAVLGLTACSSASTPAAPPATAPTAAAGVVIQDQWVKTADKGMTAVFGTVKNTAAVPVTIVSAKTSASGRTELHEVVTTSGKATMRPKQGGFTIPAGQTLKLAPGGFHIMVMDLRKPVEAGDEVTVRLTFSDGTTGNFTALAKETQAGEETYDAATGGKAHDMADM